MTNIDGLTGHHHGRSGGKSVSRNSHVYDNNHSIDLSSSSSLSSSGGGANSISTNGTRQASPASSNESKDAKSSGDEILIDVGLAMKQHVRIWRQVCIEITSSCYFEGI
jgi:hypothetical protein